MVRLSAHPHSWLRERVWSDLRGGSRGILGREVDRVFSAGQVLDKVANVGACDGPSVFSSDCNRLRGGDYKLAAIPWDVVVDSNLHSPSC